MPTVSAAISRAVLITGCSSGIGRATAEHFADRGWPVWATARRVDTLDELAGVGCRVLPLDVCDESSMRAAVSEVEAEHGAVGVLVNNAGYGHEAPVEEVSPQELRRQFETNVFGLVRLTQLVLPRMRRQGWGRIVNVSSMGGRLTLPGGGAYHASKYAVEALSDALRFELRAFGIGVAVVEPGPVRTRFGETAISAVSASDPGSPYASFNDRLARTVQLPYRGPLARLSTRPVRVAAVIERAVTAEQPRPRYVVGGIARAMLATRAVLPDRAFDRMLRLVFRPPEG